MSIFLLANKTNSGWQRMHKIAFSSRAKERTAQLGNFSLRYSWTPKNDLEPFFKASSGICFYANGLLYLNGVRIDRQWGSIYKRWQQNGAEGLQELDGYGNLLIWDGKNNCWTIITSRLGFLPIYVAKAPRNDRIVLGTHADQIASLSGNTDLDLISIADFIRTGSVCAPYTYYKNIRQLQPASVYHLDREGLSEGTRYWQPDLEHDHFLPKQEAARHLAESITGSVNKSLSQNGGKGTLLLSGGLDSRAVLFGADNPSDTLKTVTFYNNANTELDAASKLSKKAGVEHHSLQRSFDYYADCAVDAIRSTGGMWSLGSIHTSGFNEEFHTLNDGVMLTAMNFDTLFKAHAFKKREDHTKLIGRMYKTFAAQDALIDARGASDLKPDYSRSVTRRREDYYEFKHHTEEKLTPQLLNKIKYYRVQYISRKRGSGITIDLYNNHFYDSISSDIRFSDIFSYLNPYDEIEAGFMQEVLKNIDKASLSVYNANNITEHYVLNNYYLTAGRHIIKKWKKRVFGQTEKTAVGTKSSWIDWDVYRHQSASIAHLWEQCSQDDNVRTAVETTMGYNPYDLPPGYSSSYFDFLNLLTIGLWITHGYARD